MQRERCMYRTSFIINTGKYFCNREMGEPFVNMTRKWETLRIKLTNWIIEKSESLELKKKNCIKNTKGEMKIGKVLHMTDKGLVLKICKCPY